MIGWTRLLGLAVADLRATPFRSAISVFGIAVGLAVLFGTVSLGLGVRKVVLSELVRALPVDMVEVVPKKLDLGFLKVDARTLFGGSGLDQRTVSSLEKIEGVRTVYPRMSFRVPIHAQGGEALFGKRLRSDFFLDGLPEALLQESGPFEFDGDVLPLVISDQLIDVYNKSVAPALGTPELGASVLRGFEFNLQFGKSLMLGTRGAKHQGTERARVIGTSPYAMRFGATLPNKRLRELLSKYAADAHPQYRSILVRVEEPGSLGAVVSRIEDQGLTVNDEARRVGAAIDAVTMAVAAVGLLVVLLAALNVAALFFAAVTERRAQFAVMRAVGAPSHKIVLLVVGQASLLGLLGGLVGLVGGWGTLRLVEPWIVGALSHLPFRIDNLFVSPLWLMGSVIGLGLLAAVVGALWPALIAGRSSLKHALTS